MLQFKLAIVIVIIFMLVDGYILYILYIKGNCMI